MLKVKVIEDQDATALACPEVDGIAENLGDGEPSGENHAEAAELLGHITIELIDVLALEFVDILHFHDDLAAAVFVEEFGEEFLGAVVVEDEVADEYAGFGSGLGFGEVELRIEG